MSCQSSLLASGNTQPEFQPRRGGSTPARKRVRRHASAIFVMIDLLSCAFGGALFLLMISTAPIVHVDASSESMSEFAMVTITINSSSIRPIIVVKMMPEKGEESEGISFVINASHIPSAPGLRKIEGARSNMKGGRVLIVGITPWDVDIGSPLPKLRLLFEQPASNWCFLYGVASDDTNARRRSDDDMITETVETEVSLALSGKTQSLGQINLPKGIGFLSTCLPLKLM